MNDELVDVGYRDPWDERDDTREPPPSRAEYDDDPTLLGPAERLTETAPRRACT